MVILIKNKNSEQKEQEIKNKTIEETIKEGLKNTERENLIKEIKYLKELLIEKGTITQEEINTKINLFEK